MIPFVGSETDRRPGRPRDARVDAAIVDATNECLGECGFAGTTVEAIAAKAGVGKAAIYRRWPSREALLFAVAAAEVDDIVVPDTGSLRDDLVTTFTELAVQIHEKKGPGPILHDLLAEAARNDALREYFMRIVAERRKVCAAVVYRAKERGELREGIDVELVVDMLSSPIFYKKLVMFEGADHAYIEELVDAVLGGVQG
jgi:AcrR family transcriptional regulator